MANFFKDYHKELNEKRKAENKKTVKVDYEQGELVYINPMYSDGTTKRYFVDYLQSDMVLLADTKKDALSGCGYIYSVHDIVRKDKRG